MNEHERMYRALSWWRDCWNWLNECPFDDGQPFVETAWNNLKFAETQKEVHAYIRNLWKNEEAIKLIGDLEAGENSEDEVYSLVLDLMFADPQNSIGK